MIEYFVLPLTIVQANIQISWSERYFILVLVFHKLWFTITSVVEMAFIVICSCNVGHV